MIVLQSGETDASGRLPYLQKGIVAQLSKATNGLGVILEHRYYGTSFPVDDLSVENLRFLTTQQALADQAYFQQNVVFPGMGGYELDCAGHTLDCVWWFLCRRICFFLEEIVSRIDLGIDLVFWCD